MKYRYIFVLFYFFARLISFVIFPIFSKVFAKHFIIGYLFLNLGDVFLLGIFSFYYIIFMLIFWSVYGYILGKHVERSNRKIIPFIVGFAGYFCLIILFSAVGIAIDFLL